MCSRTRDGRIHRGTSCRAGRTTPEPARWSKRRGIRHIYDEILVRAEPERAAGRRNTRQTHPHRRHPGGAVSSRRTTATDCPAACTKNTVSARTHLRPQCDVDQLRGRRGGRVVGSMNGIGSARRATCSPPSSRDRRRRGATTRSAGATTYDQSATRVVKKRRTAGKPYTTVRFVPDYERTSPTDTS
jgi:hypothetical protein